MAVVPKKIQQYRILDKIEESNYAVIYKVYPVRDKSLSGIKDETRSRLRRGQVFSNGVKDPKDKPLILKIVREKNTDYNELISREFQILSQFQHPNIVSVYDYNVLDDGRAYFTSAYIPGKPIHKYFKDFSEEALVVMIQVLNGLGAFHEKGFIHTDLKPEHILYDPKEKRAVLIDFGFAGMASKDMKLAGTIGYMAPEVIKGIGIDQRSDLYSLGVILYEIFAGKKLTDPFVPIPAISSEINNTIARLISKEPALRPAVPELYQILSKYLPSVKIEIPPYQVKLPDTGFVEIPEIVEKLSARGKTFIITGDTGFGKTRLLKEMKFRYLMQDNADFGEPFGGESLRAIEPLNRTVLFYVAGEKTTFHDSLRTFINGKKIDFSGKEDKFQIYEEITSGLLGFAKDRHVVIMVDDLDNLSDYDLKLFRYIGYGIQDSSILLIGASQSDERVKKLGFETLALRPFSIEETKKLLEKTFFELKTAKASKKTKTYTDFAQWLHKESGGNPLFIVEILKTLYETNALYYEANQWQIKTDLLKEIAIPKKLDDFFETRLRTLGDEELKILKILSIAKYPLEPSFLSLMLKTDVSIRIEHLKNFGLLREEILKNRRVVVIPNQILIDVVGKGLKQKEKHSYSKSLIKAIETVMPDDKDYLPVLGQLSDDVGEADKAYKYFQSAAEDSEAIYDFESALKHYEKLAEYSKDIYNEKYPEILVKMGDLNRFIGDTKLAIDYYNEALKFRVENLLPMIYSGLGRAYLTVGDYEEGGGYCRRAIELMEEKSSEYIKTADILGYALSNLSKFKDAEMILNKSLLLSKKMKNIKMEADTLYYQASLEWFRNDFDEGIERAKKLLDFCENDESLLEYYTLGCNLLGSFYLQKADRKTAHRYLEKAIDGFEKIKHINALCAAINNKASLSLQGGGYSTAKDLYEDVFVRSQQTDNIPLQCRNLANLASIIEDLGKFEEAINLNRKALDINPEYVWPLYYLSSVLSKKGEIDKAETILEEKIRIKEEIFYCIGLAMVNMLMGKTEKAEELLNKGLDLIKKQNPEISIKVESFLKAAQFYYEKGDYEKSLDFAKKLVEITNPLGREYNIASAFIKINNFNLAPTLTLPPRGGGRRRGDISAVTFDINQETDRLKEMGCIYDYAYLKKLQIESLMNTDLKQEQIKEIAEELGAVQEVFESLGAGLELNRVKKLRDRLFPIIVKDYSRRIISVQYLETFSKLAELISSDLGNEEFTQNLLDLVIKATNAERGALFMKTSKGMELIAGRDIDQTTIKDASELSKTAVKELDKNRIVFVHDALSDPKFNIKKSVMINQIHSLLCIPLSVSGNVIGALYCDSRVAGDLFGPQDKDFLLTVSKILASVIEKSLAFQQMSEENILLRSNIIKEIGSGYLTGKSRVMKRIYKLINSVAETNSPVLVLGETGTGKGMIARLIHLKSQRKNRRFLAINCGTIPETLLESELFGHKRGAFTGAVSDKKGLLEEGEGGTIFLDEISNTSLSFQGKLLEAIEEKIIRRVGETTTRNIDVRFLFATNKDLEIEVEDHRFRKDLYYRINVFNIEVPPLRDRPSDIPLLAQFFLARYTKEIGKKIDGYAPEAMQRLREYIWSGNVRELQNVIERAVVLAKGNLITVRDIGFDKVKRDEIAPLKEIRRDAIIEALNATNWNVKKAAELLGIGRRSLHRYIKDYNIIDRSTIAISPESD